MRETRTEQIKNAFLKARRKTAGQDLISSEIAAAGSVSPPPLQYRFPREIAFSSLLAGFHFRLGLDPFLFRLCYDSPHPK